MLICKQEQDSYGIDTQECFIPELFASYKVLNILQY